MLKLPLPDRQPVRPVSAEGERPITVEWELADPMPANLVRAGRIAS